MLRCLLVECHEAAKTEEEKLQILLQPREWRLVPPDQLLELWEQQEVDPSVSLVDQLPLEARAFLMSAGKTLGKNMAGLNSQTPFQLPGTPLWVIHSSGVLEQRGRSRPAGTIPSRHAKAFCFAVRDPDHPPSPAPATGEVAAQIAAAAAAKAAEEAKTAFEQLPPTITALLSRKVVKANAKTQGWQYRALERFMYLEVDQAPPVEQDAAAAAGVMVLAPAPPTVLASASAAAAAAATPPAALAAAAAARPVSAVVATLAEPAQPVGQMLAHQEEERQRAKRPRSDSGVGSAAASSSVAAALALPVPAVPASGFRPEDLGKMVFPLVANPYFDEAGGTATLEAACREVFGPDFVMGEGRIYKGDSLEVLLQSVAQMRKKIGVRWRQTRGWVGGRDQSVVQPDIE
ncbi:hypothetical protein FOA52_005517 [Chlamydomonas sp. UWO 241]|nr:hypothetical protein FOA52_005517 [Chlamydomonas sp. UWO 241]